MLGYVKINLNYSVGIQRVCENENSFLKFHFSFSNRWFGTCGSRLFILWAVSEPHSFKIPATNQFFIPISGMWETAGAGPKRIIIIDSVSALFCYFSFLISPLPSPRARACCLSRKNHKRNEDYGGHMLGWHRQGRGIYLFDLAFFFCGIRSGVAGRCYLNDIRIYIVPPSPSVQCE